MKVILTKNVTRVGNKGDLVELAEGYARNFIIKNGFGIEATSQAIAQWKNKQSAKEQKKQKESQKEFDFATKHKDSPLVIKVNANEEGHLFEKITADKILSVIKKESGADFTKKQIDINEPIKELGDFEFTLTIEGKKFKIPFSVVQE